jgi:hypothetical protein
MKTIFTSLFLLTANVLFSQQHVAPTGKETSAENIKQITDSLAKNKVKEQAITIEYCDYMLKSIETKRSIVLQDSLHKARAESAGWFKRMEEREAFYKSEKLRLQNVEK